jgi:hypothetical protein
MRYEIVTLEAFARVSRHNSDQDYFDNLAWTFFVEDVKAAAARRSIVIEVRADEVNYDR